MTGAKKGAVLGVWAATLVAAFAAGRLTTPPETASAPDDFGAAIRAALGEEDVVERVERIASLMQQLDPENVLEAAAIYERMINILDDLDIRPFASAWARFDPAAALDHTLGWPYRDKQISGAGAVFETWAMRDPAAALQGYRDSSARFKGFSENLFLDMVTGWLYSGEEGLAEYIAGLSTQMQELAATRVAAKLMRAGGADAVISWMDPVTRNEAFENKFKKRAFRRGIRIVSRFDPERAAAWAMEHAGEVYAVDAPRVVAGGWGARDGPAAIQWVRDHPTEKLRDQALREAFRTWFKSEERDRAVAWLESETLTAFHDPAVLFYAKELTDHAPDEAIVWCERIVDSERRLRCLKSAAREWYQRDAVAAEAWLQQSPLDEEQRRTARTPKRKRNQSTRRPGV